jgi:hypothetical protein
VRALTGIQARIGAVVAVALAGLLLAAPAFAGTVDQQQTVSSPGQVLVSGPGALTSSAAQTFTPGLSGKLDRVDLFIGNDGGATGPLTVEIRDTSSGSPGTTVLASASVPASSIPGFLMDAFTPVTFSTPANVLAATKYAIVAYAGGTNTYDWDGSATDVYGGGQQFGDTSSPPDNTWPAGFGTDLAFKTYVCTTTPCDASSTPPPAAGPTGLRAAALKKCAKKKSKAKKKKCKKRARKLPI